MFVPACVCMDVDTCQNKINFPGKKTHKWSWQAEKKDRKIVVSSARLTEAGAGAQVGMEMEFLALSRGMKNSSRVQAGVLKIKSLGKYFDTKINFSISI